MKRIFERVRWVLLISSVFVSLGVLWIPKPVHAQIRTTRPVPLITTSPLSKSGEVAPQIFYPNRFTYNPFALMGKRIAAFKSGTLYVKEGALNAPWVTEATNIQGYALEGNRIGILKGGTLYVKEGALNTPWVTEYKDVSNFALEGKRIAIQYASTL